MSFAKFNILSLCPQLKKLLWSLDVRQIHFLRFLAKKAEQAFLSYVSRCFQGLNLYRQQLYNIAWEHRFFKKSWGATKLTTHKKEKEKKRCQLNLADLPFKIVFLLFSTLRPLPDNPVLNWMKWFLADVIYVSSLPMVAWFAFDAWRHISTNLWRHLSLVLCN